MSLLSALALSVGVLAGVAAWLFLGPLAGALPVWVTFIAWGCFYHCGGKTAGLRNTIVCTCYGALLAWVSLLIVTKIPLAASIGLPLWAGIVVGVAVAIIVLSANVPALGVIPATVYGYASMAGYALLSKPGLAGLTDASVANPIIGVLLALVIGAVFAYVSEMIGMALVKKAPAAATA